MSFGRFLISKAFIKNLFFAVCVTFVIYIATFLFLKMYTRHSESITLPDFMQSKLEEVIQNKDYRYFHFVVIDSVYDETKEKGSIMSQDPLPDSPVKRGRKVYLTVVAHLPEQVSTPDLVNLSVRQAVSLLETYGLKVGQLSFVPVDEIEKGNPVLYLTMNGDTLEPNTMVEKGSVIDVVAGKPTSESQVPVPFLIGRTFDDAVQTIKKSSLNFGRFYYLDEEDPVHSKVYRQTPDFLEGIFINMGTTIDIWLRSDKKFDFTALIKRYKPDSTEIIEGFGKLPEYESDSID